MVKRLCVLYPDGSVSIMSLQDGNAASSTNRARRECLSYNKTARDATELAEFGEIDIDLMSFKLLR